MRPRVDIRRICRRIVVARKLHVLTARANRLRWVMYHKITLLYREYKTPLRHSTIHMPMAVSMARWTLQSSLQLAFSQEISTTPTIPSFGRWKALEELLRRVTELWYNPLVHFSLEDIFFSLERFSVEVFQAPLQLYLKSFRRIVRTVWIDYFVGMFWITYTHWCS